MIEQRILDNRALDFLGRVLGRLAERLHAERDGWPSLPGVTMLIPVRVSEMRHVGIAQAAGWSALCVGFDVGEPLAEIVVTHLIHVETRPDGTDVGLLEGVELRDVAPFAYVGEALEVFAAAAARWDDDRRRLDRELREAVARVASR